MKKSDNTTLFIVIGIFVFAIIIGTIIGSSYKFIYGWLWSLC